MTNTNRMKKQFLLLIIFLATYSAAFYHNPTEANPVNWWLARMDNTQFAENHKHCTHLKDISKLDDADGNYKTLANTAYDMLDISANERRPIKKFPDTCTALSDGNTVTRAQATTQYILLNETEMKKHQDYQTLFTMLHEVAHLKHNHTAKRHAYGMLNKILSKIGPKIGLFCAFVSLFKPSYSWIHQSWLVLFLLRLYVKPYSELFGLKKEREADITAFSALKCGTCVYKLRYRNQASRYCSPEDTKGIALSMAIRNQYCKDHAKVSS
jgi:Peptidase family M48